MEPMDTMKEYVENLQESLNRGVRIITAYQEAIDETEASYLLTSSEDGERFAEEFEKRLKVDDSD
ncbi:MAG: hypothetical protein ACLFTQ_00045 [Candidatus Aenigmatarchaeota archaeon]